MSNENYYQESNKQHIYRLKDLLTQLPGFCDIFFRGISPTTNALTRLNYAYDLRTFFFFLEKEIWPGKDYKTITPEDLNALEAVDIEHYLDYLSLYTAEPENEESKVQERENNEKGKARKLACIRTFFKYLFRKGYLTRNVAELVDMPKIHFKEIVRLDVPEIVRILNIAESGENLSKVQKRYHKEMRQRDVAILSVFLGTGVRISELVGLNMNDVDFENESFLITRKGGNQMTLYYNQEVKAALSDYLQERRKIDTLIPDDPALFLSLQRKRISVRAVQNLVKKYALIAAPLKNISPHKLRSTYGTELYRETGDIYLVADVLGHKDVNTTRKHYAAMEQDRRRAAAKAVKLRD